MKRLLILQNEIPHYRLPLYNALSREYELTVVHSGVKLDSHAVSFREWWVKATRIGPFTYQHEVRRVIRSQEWDVVIAMFDLWWINNVTLALRSRDFRFLFWGHRYSTRRIANVVRNILMRRCDGIILYGDEDIPCLLSAGISKERIWVAWNTMNVDSPEDTSKCPKSSFVFVGRAQKRKRIGELINVFAEVASELPAHCQIEIVGDGAENIALQKLATCLCIQERVLFHGAITEDSALSHVFRRAYAYVSPGPVGLGVLHSFAHGVPVVTSSGRGHGPEVHNIKNGVNSVVYSDTSELKRTLVKLANDALYAQSLGRCAYDHYINERTIEKMVIGFRRAIENHCPYLGG